MEFNEFFKNKKTGAIINDIKSELKGGLNIRGKIYFLCSTSMLLEKKRIKLHLCVLPTNSFSLLAIFETPEIKDFTRKVYFEKKMNKSLPKKITMIKDQWKEDISLSELGLQGKNYFHFDTPDIFKYWTQNNVSGIPGKSSKKYKEKIEEYKIISGTLKSTDLIFTGVDYSLFIKDKKGNKLKFKKLKEVLESKKWVQIDKVISMADYGFAKTFKEHLVILYFVKRGNNLTYRGFKIKSEK